MSSISLSNVELSVMDPKKDLNSLLLVMEAISNEIGSHDKNHFRTDVWKWQYEALPSKISKIYLAKIRDKIIGYYHVPTYSVSVEGKLHTIGNVQAVGVLSKFRKYGVFRKLAEFANNDLTNHVDFIYSFPNSRSINTFIKYNNYKKLIEMPALLLPLDLSMMFEKKTGSKLFATLLNFPFLIFLKAKRKRLGVSDIIEEQDFIGKDILDLFRDFDPKSKISIIRDQDYFNWRYLNYPRKNYKLFVLKNSGQVEAACFCSFEEILGSSGIIIMDIAYSNKVSCEKLLSNIAKYLSETVAYKANFIYFSGVHPNLSVFKRIGFLKIPTRLNPRPLNLVVKNIKINNEKLLMNQKNWLVTSGDWDVF